jgi:hypothetical protein
MKRKTVKDQIIGLIEDVIPSPTIKDMHPKFGLPFGIFMMFAGVILFLLILTKGYLSEIQERYLSPSTTSSSSLCDSVSISNSGSYLLSTEGYWEGDSSFSYSTAIYRMTILNLEMSEDKYESFINAFQSLTNYISSNITANSDLVINILFWTSYVARADSKSNRLHMNADPTIVFDREFISGGLTSINGDCNKLATTTYDKTNGKLIVEYSKTAFETDSICASILNPTLLGYGNIDNSSQLKFHLDITTLVTASALNLDIVSVGNIQEVYNSSITVELMKGISGQFSYYLDPRYSGMKPVFCSDEKWFPFCLILYGNLVAMPIFIHAGNNFLYPTHCNCSEEAGLPENANNPDYLCNQFNFLFGILFYNTNDSTPLVRLAMKYSYREIIYLSLYPMFAGSAFSTYNTPLYTSELYRSHAYQFCNMEGYGTCNFLLFSFFDVYTDFRTLGSNYYPFQTGSCNENALSISDESW